MDTIKQCQVDIATYESELETLRTEFSTIQASLRTARQDKSAADQALADLLASIDANTDAGALSALEPQIRDARNAVTAADAALATARQSRTTKNDEITAKEEQIRTCQKDLQASIDGL